MKLELEQDTMPQDLYQELGFIQFLDLFDRQLPVLPTRTLRPMSASEGEAHFQALVDLERKLDPTAVKRFLDLGRELPALENLLPHYQTGWLEQYHLFELGQFLLADLEMHRLEADLSLPLNRLDDLADLLRILEQRTENTFSRLRLSEAEKQQQEAIAQAEKDLAEALNEYEGRILASTGLKMIYPWPKEVALTEDMLSRIRGCALVTVHQRGDIWRVDFRPDAEILRLVAQRDSQAIAFEASMQHSLTTLNLEIAGLYPTFAAYYRTRQQRIWQYLLIAVKLEQELCFPHLTSELCCHLQQAWLPVLKARKDRRCIPLDLSLATGANVLYGANMSGKTTVLKTVYFLFTLIRFGLPAPAKAIEMHFPEHISLMLKSSGNIRTDTSTFSEEIDFFSRTLPSKAFVLADELFSSTDPLNGALLSDIFLSEFNSLDLMFFCTSHYPEVLDMPGISLFRMLDIDPQSLHSGIRDIKTLQDRMPYRLEAILDSPQRALIRKSHIPLELALLYELPAGIKERIRQRLLYSSTNH